MKERYCICTETNTITPVTIDDLWNADALPAPQLCFVCGKFWAPALTQYCLGRNN